MARTGRNAPCPCGSGKKYKKCCLSLDEAAPLSPPEDSAFSELESFTDDGWERDDEWLEEDDEWLEGNDEDDWDDDLFETAEPVFRRAGLADADLDDIVARCAALGVDVTRRAFLVAVEGRTSAQEVARDWCSAREEATTRAHRHLLEDAAWELWRRYGVASPCCEMVSEAIARGMALGLDDDPEPALEALLLAWSLAERLLPPEVTTTGEAGGRLRLQVAFRSWFQSIAADAIQIAGDRLDLVERVLRLCDAWADRFVDESSTFLVPVACFAAELCAKVGDHDEADRRFADATARHPEHTRPRAGRAIALRKRPEWPQVELVGKALALTVEARDRPTLDHRFWTLDENIEALLDEAPELSPPPPQADVLAAVCALFYCQRKYPAEALETIVASPHEAIEPLMQALDDVRRSPDLVTEETEIHIFAILLLGHLRHAPAHTAIIDTLRSAGVLCERLFGDSLVELLPAMLHRTAMRSPDMMIEALRDAGLPDMVREPMAYALRLAVADGYIEREGLLDILASELAALPDGEESEAAATFASTMLDLHPGDRVDVILAALERGAIEPWALSPADVRHEVDKREEAALAELQSRLARAETDDVHAWVRSWAWFTEASPLLGLPPRPASMGRPSTQSARQTPSKPKKPKRNRKAKARRKKKKKGQRR